jgi:CheY-like chemotaxis protein
MIDYIKYNFQREKFLIADDDIYSYLLLEKMLKRTGATIIHAKDGREALDLLLRDRSITVAILDIIMPYLSGIEVLLKCKSYLPETSFIAYTADTIRYDIDFLKKVGFILCIPKPILPVKFLGMMEEALSLRGQLLEE